jgi:hypothetical protein
MTSIFKDDKYSTKDDKYSKILNWKHMVIRVVKLPPNQVDP